MVNNDSAAPDTHRTAPASAAEHGPTAPPTTEPSAAARKETEAEGGGERSSALENEVAPV